METTTCPNMNSCQLIVVEDFELSQQKRSYYKEVFCIAGSSAWKACTRYQTKLAINFCPDFVLPDSVLTPDEVIDRFDLENT